MESQACMRAHDFAALHQHLNYLCVMAWARTPRCGAPGVSLLLLVGGVPVDRYELLAARPPSAHP